MKPNREIKKYIKEHLKKGRYKHSLRVAQVADDLAVIHGADRAVVKKASLLHDCAKNREEELLKVYDLSDIIDSNCLEDFPQVVHAFLARKVCQDVFGIDEQVILDAVTYHTTGRPKMTDEEKIVYLADGLEPGRNYKNRPLLYKMAKEDLDRAMHFSLAKTRKRLKKKGRKVHPLSYSALKYFNKKV